MVKRLIFILCLILCLPITVVASPLDLVTDDAGLLQGTEIETVAEGLGALNQEFGVDFILVTTDDAQGKNSRAYADDFYDEKFGIDHDGGILLIDMDNREIVISLSNKAIDIVTDGKQKDLLDLLYPSLSEGEYFNVGMVYIETIREYMLAGVPAGHRRVEAQNSGLDSGDVGLASLLGLGIGGGFFGAKRKQYKFKPKDKKFPLFQNSIKDIGMKDSLIDTRVVTRTIPKTSTSSGSSHSTSSVYRSSSGGTHSSSSRKF